MTRDHQSEVKFSAPSRLVVGIVSILGLILVFLFQRVNWADWLGAGDASAIRQFLINRSVRFVLNDIFAILLVAALFGKRKLVIIAIFAQFTGFLFVLLPYAILKLNYPSYNGPLISFLHRLILNPLLIYLLIFYFWYQEKHGSVK